MSICEPSAGQPAALMDQVVKFLKERSFQIAVIISLVAHVCLILFAAIRRRRRPSRSLRRRLLWVSYQLADWAPGYVLGNLYLEERNTKNLIVAFWVPFLLLNIRPDNISAYASEDNKLSLRPIVSFGLQILGIIYVLARHDYTGTAGTLRYASIIMYVYGLAKYSENLLALRRGDLKRIQKRFEKVKKKQCCPPQYTQGSLDYQKARLVAHDLLLIPVGGINAAAKVHPSISSSLGRDRDILMVVQMEVQLLYDLIYTKTAVVYTWHGYLLRLASPVLTTAALVLFSFQCREGHDPSDATVTFILLVTTLALDLMWLVITLGSTWTYAYLKDRPGHWLHDQVHRGGRWHQLRAILVSLDPCRFFVMEPRKYSSWPDETEQLSMLKMGSRGRTAQREIEESMAIPSARQNRQPQSENLMEEAKDLLFSRIWESSKSASSTGPEDTPAKKAGLPRRRRPLGDALPFGPEIQEVMISWHMATEMFLLSSVESYQSSSRSVYVKAIMALSNHLMFLAAERPEMLPGLNVHSLFQSTKLILKEIWSNKRNGSAAASREKELADTLREKWRKLRRPAGRPGTSEIPKTDSPVISPCNYWSYQCRCTQENNCNWGCQCHCHAVQENPCSWSHQYRCSGSCQCDGTDDPIACDQKNTGCGKEEEKDGSDDEERPHEDDSQDQELNSIILDGVSFSEALIHVASGEEGLSACLNRMEEKTKDRFLNLMPEFRDPPMGKLDIPVILDLMFDTWVRMLIHAAVLSSRDSHEKQLSRGSEFLTTIWILTAHAGIEDHID